MTTRSITQTFRFLLIAFGILQTTQAFADDPVIKDPKIRQLYFYYKSQCHDGSLPPEQQSQACELSIRYGTLESEIEATNTSNKVKALFNQRILDALQPNQ